jgi:hypothetical protein
MFRQVAGFELLVTRLEMPYLGTRYSTLTPSGVPNE